MMRARAALLLLLLLLAALGWWLTSADPANAPDAAFAAGATAGTATWDTRNQREDSPHRNRVSSLADGEVLIRVESGGHPVAGTSLGVRRTTHTDGWVQATSISLLGTTDPSGILTCPWSSLAGKTLGARKQGYLVTEVDLEASQPGRSLRIELQPAARLTVTARTRDGQPVMGAEVALSMARLSEGRSPDPQFATRLPIGDPTTAVFTAKTDERGQAVMTMLPCGLLSTQTHHPHFCRTASGSNQTKLVPGDNQLTLLFDPTYLALGLVTDDEVLSWAIKTPSGAYIDASVMEQTQWVSPWWTTQAGSAPLCFVGAARWRDDHYEDIDSHAEFSVFTQSYGTCEVSVRLARADQWTGPDQIQIGHGRQRVPSSNVRVVLKDPDGRLHDCLTGISMRLTEGDGILRVPLGPRSGTEFRVPNGTYEISTNQPFLKAQLHHHPCPITSEGQVALDIPMPVRSCRIEWRHPSSERLVDDGVLTFSWADQSHRAVMSHRLSAHKWTLPVGTVRVALTSEAGSFDGELTVPPGTGLHVARFRLRR